jgi:Ca2+-binding RTX toxin-like protein
LIWEPAQPQRLNADKNGGVSNIENITGSAYGNTLIGNAADNILIGGSGDDTIKGMAGNDILIGLAGNDTLDGGTGTDTVDYSSNTVAGIILSLLDGTASSSESGTDTLAGIENVIGTDFNDTITGDKGNNRLEGRGGDDIINGGEGNDILLGGEGDDTINGNEGDDTLNGGSGNNILTGGSGNDTYLFEEDWSQAVIIEAANDGNDTIDFTALSLDLSFILMPDGGSVTSGLRSVSWNGIAPEILKGGSGNDNFAFENGASLPVTVHGGGGSNTLDYSNYGSAIALNLQNSTATGLSGFAGIQALIGSALADSLTGFNADTLFTIAGANAGTVNGSFSFSAIENLTGGSGKDTFAFTGSGSLAGNINGGSGSNTLDYSGYTDGGVQINLGTNQATGLGGTFISIANFIGSPAEDRIIGPDTDTVFQISDANKVTVNGLNFDGFESLKGGSGNDSFRFADGAGISGTIDGGAGTDTIDFSAYTTGVTANLAGQFVAGGLTGSITDVENLTGGKGDDTLTGNDSNNIITGGGGRDIMDGGKGNDEYIFNSGWGTGDEIIDAEGDDTVTFAGLTVALTFNLDEGIWSVSDGVNTLQHSGYTIEHIISGSGNDIFNINGSAKGHLAGGGGDDSFRFNDSGSLEGSIDGGIGNNNIDYRNYTAGGATVNLAANEASGLAGSFSNISKFWGSAAIDELIGADGDNIFNITGMYTGNVNNVYTFEGFENITGGSGNDIFNMGTNGVIGAANGGSGQDTLNYASYQRAVDITITAADANGFAGTEASLTGGFSGIDLLKGTSRSDSFTGMNETAAFDLDKDSTVYRALGFSLNLAAFENLIGGNKEDTFTINGTLTLNLSGADGNDSFIYKDNAKLTGSLDGGAGNDTIDFSLYQTAQKVVLTALGTIDGFNGTHNLVSGGFRNIDSIVSSSAGDTLTGRNSDAVFDLDTSRYISGNTLNYSGFKVLQGGTGNDTFLFTAATGYTGKIDGGTGGTDTLDYSGCATDVTVDLAKGIATGVNDGAEKSVSNIEKIIGSRTHNNTLTGDNGNNIFVAGTAQDILSGGSGNDTYIFLVKWGQVTIIENKNEGTDTIDASAIDSKLNFRFETAGITVATEEGNIISTTADLENYIGGSNDDSFNLCDEAVVNGKIDGGGGNDTLDYHEYNKKLSYVLAAIGTSDGFRGTESSIKGGFDNIDTIVGSTQTDSLTGIDAAAVWNIGTTGFTYTSEGRTLNVSAVEDLTGGSAADIFSFADGAIHTGSIKGGKGADLLDYSLYTTGITVDLTAGSASNVSGTLAEFENVTGGSGDDQITGDNKDNVLIGGAGNDTIRGEDGNDTLIGGSGDDTMYGGKGNDTYQFEDGWGNDTITENAKEGNSTLDLATVIANLTIRLEGNGVVIGDGSNSLSHSTLEVAAINSGAGADIFEIGADANAALYGGDGNDRFVLADGIAYSGLLDGQGGSDILDFSNYSSARNVTLTGTGTNDGFKGQESNLKAGFTNIDSIVGGSAADTLTGINSDAVFTLDDVCSYNSSGRTLTFSGFEILRGGSGQDRFDIIGTRTFDLYGGAGNDSFVFADQARLNGILDGQAGNDTLDFSAYTTPRNISLTAAGSSGGFNGRESCLGQFANINNINGSMATDSISGLDSDATWQIGSNSSYTSGNASLKFASVENLFGGAKADRFVLQKDYKLEGTIDGRGGDDVLDYSNYVYGSVIEVDMNKGYASGTANGITSIKNVILPKEVKDPQPVSGGGGGGGGTLPSNIIYRETGGTVQNLGVIVVVPVLTLPEDAEITIKEVVALDATTYVPAGLAVKLGSKIYEIETTGAKQFGDNNFITIKIPYDPGKINAGEHPVVHYFDEITRQWVEIPSVVEYDEITGQWMAVVKVNHLTKFAVFSTNLDIKLVIGSPLVTVGKQQYQLDAVPYIDDIAWRTMVPVRFISEVMGAEVEWIDAERKVVIRKADKEIVLVIDSNKAYVNGQEILLDCDAKIMPPGRTFVPVRFISETLGARVEYNSETQQITIFQ